MLRFTRCLQLYRNSYQKPGQKFQKYWNPNDNNQMTTDIDIRNYNLCINKDDFDLFMFCFHPQIGKKGPTTYEVKKNSTVMAISIVEKMKNVAEEMQWNNRKSFTFKFMDLGKLLIIEPGKGNKSSIQLLKRDGETVTTSKELHLSDDIEKKHIQLTLTHTSKKIEEGKLLDTDIDKPLRVHLPYHDYKLFYELIRSSLFELSGWKFQMELQRAQLLQKIKGQKHDQGLDNMPQRRNYGNQNYSGGYNNQNHGQREYGNQQGFRQKSFGKDESFQN